LAEGKGPVDDAEFRDALLEAVDYGLLVLGEIVRRTIYERLETSYLVKRTEIPDKLLFFHEALASLFGRRGTVVERLIAKRLFGKLKLSFEGCENWTLVDYVNYARTALPIR